jgi:putative membrane protein insertion efficiency factor
MVWIRRYPGPYDDPYYGRGGGWGYRRRGYGGGGGGGCLRDACLIESGCCLGEALDQNCLIAGVLLLPQLFKMASTGPGRGRRGMLKAIRLYQTEISAHRPAVCRFTPSCSNYAAEAIEKHGARRGTWLAARRLLRCRPYGMRGQDPVPA